MIIPKLLKSPCSICINTFQGFMIFGVVKSMVNFYHTIDYIEYLYIVFVQTQTSTHCGLVTLYDDTDLGQHWFR